MAKKKPEDEAQRAAAAIVNCGDMDRGVEIVREQRARAVAASRPSIILGVKIDNSPNGDCDGQRHGDGLIEVYIPAGQCGALTVAEKLRELASFIVGSTIDARGGAVITILTRSKANTEGS